jgi:hypothetical protein
MEFLYAAFVWAILFGGACPVVASLKGRDWFPWMVAGFFFGGIAFLIVLVVPAIRRNTEYSYAALSPPQQNVQVHINLGGAGFQIPPSGERTYSASEVAALLNTVHVKQAGISSTLPVARLEPAICRYCGGDKADVIKPNGVAYHVACFNDPYAAKLRGKKDRIHFPRRSLCLSALS